MNSTVAALQALMKNWMYPKAGQDQLILVPRGMEFPVLMGG